MPLLSLDTLTQLTCYGFMGWSVFAAIAATMAWRGSFLGVVAGWVAVAAIIAVLDLLWIRGEMSNPGWDGDPDQDAIFMLGVLIRASLVNVLLLPVSLASSMMRQRLRPTESLPSIASHSEE